jgi:hypothetical protein
MRGVDLARYAFDFDLTLGVLFAHPNGRVYHRYGGHDERGPDRWLGLTSFERVLAATLDEHEAYAPEDAPPVATKRVAIEEIPAFAKRDKGECIHCHSVFPAFYEEARDAGRWSEDDRWVHPPPSRIGLDLDPADPALVVAVAADSAAATAGLRAGDRLLRHGADTLLTYSDLAYVLHEFPAEGGPLALEYERDGEPAEATLALPPAWKRGTPLEFSWRPFKWGFTPTPGFGGRQLAPDQIADLGLEAGTFAFRIKYLVTWGDNRRYGVAAQRAGVREDDVFLSAAGFDDFASHGHFHAWWRLTRTAGERLPVVVLRDGERLTLELTVPGE